MKIEIKTKRKTYMLLLHESNHLRIKYVFDLCDIKNEKT